MPAEPVLDALGPDAPAAPPPLVLPGAPPFVPPPDAPAAGPDVVAVFVCPSPASCRPEPTMAQAISAITMIAAAITPIRLRCRSRSAP